MGTLHGLTKKITGKDLLVVGVKGWFLHGEKCIEVPGGKGFKESVVHEVCHWVIAEEWQRVHPSNLGYGHTSDGSEDRDPRCTQAFIDRQEIFTCHLQRTLYQFAGLTFPKSSPSCRGSRLLCQLSGLEAENILGKACHAGLQDLIALARARK